jgi:hypothetical protein
VRTAGNKVVARRKSPRRAAKTTGQSIAGTSKELVFVLSPFGDPFDSYYDQITRPSIEQAGFRALRADQIFGTNHVVTDIWQSIQEAKIVVAEMTGKNANVLYEVGLCHAIGKPVVMITQTMDDVPFDLRSIRCITYSTTEPGWNIELKSKLCQTLAAVVTLDDHWIISRPSKRDVSRGNGTFSLPLTDAIRACILGKHEINEMRIFAVTSATILSIIEGSKFSIGTCSILLPRFVTPVPATREAKTKTEVHDAVKSWKLLKKNGRIKTLQIRYYDKFPSHYCCVFDNFAVLLGTYTYRRWDIQFSDALVIANNDPVQALVTRWFDDVFGSSKRFPRPGR